MPHAFAPDCLAPLSASSGHRQNSFVPKVALVSAMLIFSASTADAEIINGGFETGDLTGWTVFNDFNQNSVEVRTHFEEWQDFAGVTPTEGGRMAFVRFLGRDDTPVTTLQQSFLAGAGDTLSLDYAIQAFPLFSGPFGPYGVGAGTVRLLHPGGGTTTIANTSFTPAGSWASAVVPLTQAGNYTLRFQVSGYGDTDVLSMMLVDHVALNQLTTEATPIFPTTIFSGTPDEPPIFIFEDVPSGQWFDPPMAAGFAYEMTGDSLFTGILDFPTGFDQPFTVAVGDTVLGQFGPGQSVDFTSFAGGGVSNFQITGLDPGADPESPTAFPLRLMFDTNSADFTMQAILEVPEPSSLALCVLGALGLVLRLRIARHRRRHG